MLNKIDNETVCRVGPGTPMGRLMREYWVPALLSRELGPRESRKLLCSVGQRFLYLP